MNNLAISLTIIIAVVTACKTDSPTMDLPQVIAKGEFPDLVVDKDENFHVVYGRNDSLFYKKYEIEDDRWSDEMNPGGLRIISGKFGIRRSDPDIVIDSKGHPHIFAGSDYTYWNGNKWVNIRPLERDIRDTELAIDSKDNVYLVHRGGNFGGDIGLLVRKPDDSKWNPLPDPDNEKIGMSDHVYPDIEINSKDHIFIVQRHAYPWKGTQVNISYDMGTTWKNEKLTEIEPESPHIIIPSNDSVFVTHGGGEFYKRIGDSVWVSEGYPIHVEEREQPELAADLQSNIYVFSHGGKYNIRKNGAWVGAMKIKSYTGKPVGFVEPYGGHDVAYAVWEEADSVDANEGADLADIVLGKFQIQKQVEE